MITELLPLGTNGFYASHGRLTMAFLCIGKGATDEPVGMLLDAGSGVGRLVEPAIAHRLQQLTHLDVVLTHYHLDHVCGLPALPAALSPKLPVTVWAPAPPLVDISHAESLDRLLSPPLFPVGFDTFFDRIALRRYSHSDDLDLRLAQEDHHRLRVRRQDHAGGSVGLRFGDQLAYITDTKASDQTVDLVRGVDLLLHETWVSAEEAEQSPESVTGHSSARQVRDIAEKAQVRRLLPVHHRPDRTADDLRALHQTLKGNGFELVEAVEGTSLSLEPPDPSTALS